MNMDRQFSQSFTASSDSTVGLPLELEDKLKRVLPGFDLESTVNTFFIHSFYETPLPNNFEVNSNELVLMASVVDEKILDMGKKEGKVIKTSDGQSITMVELSRLRKHSGKNQDLNKMLHDRNIELKEKDDKLKQTEKKLKEKEKELKETKEALENLNRKCTKLEKGNEELEKEKMHVCEKKQDSKIVELQKKLDDRTNELQEKYKELKTKEKELKEKDDELKKIEKELKDTKAAFENKGSEMNEMLQIKENLLIDIDEKYKKSVEKNEELEKENKHLREKFNIEKQKLEADIRDKTKRIQEFETEMEQVNQYNTKLWSDQKQLEKKCQNLEGKLIREGRTIECMKEDHEDEIRKIHNQTKDLVAERDDLRDRFEIEKQKLEADIRDKTERLQEFDTQMEQMNQYNTKMWNDLKQLVKKCQNLEGKLIRERRTIECMKEDHEDEIRKIHNQTKDLVAERDDLRNRYSKLCGAKLSDQEPDIAVLSGPNRAMKLSDKYLELYDDQWTDAFEALQGKKKTAREAIEILLNVLKKCEEFFNILRERQMNGLKNVLLHPSQDISKFGTDARKHFGGLKEHERLTSADKKAMRELRRQVGVSEGVLEEVQQVFVLETKTWKEKKLLECCTPYLHKCAELCWLIVTHDPPLYIKFDVKHGDHMDLNLYKRYSSSGSTIDYLVWPALFNEKDGGLLLKGTAEPIIRTVKKY